MANLYLFVLKICHSVKVLFFVMKKDQATKQHISTLNFNFVAFEETYTNISGLKLRVRTKKIIFLFLNQNLWCGYSKEPSHSVSMRRFF